MRRCLFALACLVPFAALADEPGGSTTTPAPANPPAPVASPPPPPAVPSSMPDFGKGGVIFSIQYGYGLWQVNQGTLAATLAQSNPSIGSSNAAQYAQFTNELRNTQTASLRLGYNILGHATIEADFTATGWNIFDADRGGAGWLAGVVHWHPIEIFMQGKERPFDASVFFGIGYGIGGGPVVSGGPSYGMDGLIYEAGIEADYYFAPGFALSIFARWIFLDWKNFYLNYDDRSQPGNTLAVGSSIGNFFTIGGALTFRFVP
jgi:hypothetical protein